MKKQIILVVLLMMLVGFANAFKVSPVKLELSIPRGQTREIVLTLNGSNGTNIENLIIYPTDLSVSKTGVYTFQRIENSKFSAVPWIKISDTKISLNEAQTKTLKFKISVPMDANPGEYYSIIMIEPEKDTRMKSREKPLAMDYKVRIGVVLILDVPGRIYAKIGKALSTEMIPITPELIRQIKAETMNGKYDNKHELFYALPDIEKLENKTLILGNFQNFGNTHLYVSGTAIIRSRDGRSSFGQTKLVAMGNTKEQVFTFPGDERYFIGVWEKQLPKGEYICDAMYDYGSSVTKAKASSDFSFLVKRMRMNPKTNTWFWTQNCRTQNFRSGIAHKGGQGQTPTTEQLMFLWNPKIGLRWSRKTSLSSPEQTEISKRRFQLRDISNSIMETKITLT